MRSRDSGALFGVFVLGVLRAWSSQHLVGLRYSKGRGPSFFSRYPTVF